MPVRVKKTRQNKKLKTDLSFIPSAWRDALRRRERLPAPSSQPIWNLDGGLLNDLGPSPFW